MNQTIDLIILCYANNAIGEVSRLLENPNHISSASSRLQLSPMITAAQKIGWTTSTWSLHSEKPENLQDLTKLNGIKRLVIGKMSSNNQKSIHSMIMANSAAIFLLKSKGVPITIMYSDNHLAKEDQIGSFYRSIFTFADTVITPSNALKNEVNKYTDGTIKVHVIKDPWQTPALSFNKTEHIQDHVKLIWFGNGLNIDYLIECLPKIIEKCNSSKHFELSILAQSEIINYFKKVMPDSVKSLKKWSINYIKWDNKNQPSQFHNALAEAHISLIPSNPGDPKKLGVSHNRLVDSIRSGCIPIASPINSYLELSNISVLGDNFPAMIDFTILNYKYLCEKFEPIRKKQLAEFDPEVNAKNWENLVKTLASK